MATAPDNLQQLLEGGVIKSEELPQEYAELVEGLSPDEVNAIIGVKQRLDEAGSISDIPAEDVFFAP
jgi:hypothetical protein